MSSYSVIVSFESSDEIRRGIKAAIGSVAKIIYLTKLSKKDRITALKKCSAIIVLRPKKELSAEELSMFDGKLIQSLTAGVDTYPFSIIPPSAILAHNGGAFAQPMAEYVLGVLLNHFRKLQDRYNKLKIGNWDQFLPTRMLRGLTCGIIGYGSTGKEITRLLHPMGVNIKGINSKGKSEKHVKFMGTLEHLDTVLSSSDIVIITIALNKATHNLFDSIKFSKMKTNAIFINIARGKIVDQQALYDWLITNKDGYACIDAWWREPVTEGDYNTEFPFLELPNFFGSPHNSAIVHGAYEYAANHAALNVRKFILGKKIQRIVNIEDQRK